MRVLFAKTHSRLTIDGSAGHMGLKRSTVMAVSRADPEMPPSSWRTTPETLRTCARTRPLPPPSLYSRCLAPALVPCTRSR